MAYRYASLPNLSPSRLPSQHDREEAMRAAFDYSDLEEDHDEDNAVEPEAQPLNPKPSTTSVGEPLNFSPASYNFESMDYDNPPPGSPPPPSTTAIPNDHGNSNGIIPTFSLPQSRHPHLFKRIASVLLPSSVMTKFSRRPCGPIGDGTNNDGVFANVTAKPTPARVDGDDIFLVPEDIRTEAPPSYASAQADAVPPYWETTVHAPLTPGSIGEIMVDSLPTGTLFSFCWNLLVSISFQFVGFLLTYLLHTSHAARLGSRAGLGVTLIQYGFALRTRLNSKDNADWNSDFTTEGSQRYHRISQTNITWSTPFTNITEEETTIMVANATTEWLSFFLMTVGWFVLLTSLLAFWRVKRWERGILSSQRDINSSRTPSQVGPGLRFMSQLESSFGLRGVSRTELLRRGFGFGSSRSGEEESHAATLVEEGNASHSIPEARPTNAAVIENQDPVVLEVLASERRLHRDLRDAGLL